MNLYLLIVLVMIWQVNILILIAMKFYLSLKPLNSFNKNNYETNLGHC